MPPEHILRCGDKNFPDCGKEIFDKGEFDGFACFTESGWLLEIPMNRKKSGLGPCVRSRFVWNGTFGKAERDDVRLPGVPSYNRPDGAGVSSGKGREAASRRPRTGERPEAL